MNLRDWMKETAAARAFKSDRERLERELEMMRGKNTDLETQLQLERVRVVVLQEEVKLLSAVNVRNIERVRAESQVKDDDER